MANQAELASVIEIKERVFVDESDQVIGPFINCLHLVWRKLMTEEGKTGPGCKGIQAVSTQL